MKENKLVTWSSNTSGFKVVEVNVADTTENLYAVVTPVKNNDKN